MQYFETIQTRNSKPRLWPVVLIFMLLMIFAIPVQGLGRTYTAMDFPTETVSQASVLFWGNRRDYEQERWSTRIVVTSYNSVPEQTDDTPFVTAFGTTVRDGIVASNFLPRGARVRFPDIFGSKVFVVEDRMNARYYKRVDIWSADQEFSKEFGARYLRMEIL